MCAGQAVWEGVCGGVRVHLCWGPAPMAVGGAAGLHRPPVLVLGGQALAAPLGVGLGPCGPALLPTVLLAPGLCHSGVCPFPKRPGPRLRIFPRVCPREYHLCPPLVYVTPLILLAPAPTSGVSVDPRRPTGRPLLRLSSQRPHRPD